MPTLRVKNAEGLRDVPLPAGRYSIGRTTDNDLTLPGALLSRHQAAIEFQSGQFVLTDLQSSNGTYVNGHRVERRILQHGDLILLGETELTFLTTTDDRPRTAPAVPAPPGLSQAAPTPQVVAPPGLTTAPSPAEKLLGSSDVIKKVAEIAAGYDEEARAQTLRQQVVQDSVSSSMFYLLYQVAKDLAKAPTLEATLRDCMKRILSGIRADRGCVLMVRPGSDDLVPAISFQRKEGVLKELPGISLSIARRVLQERVGIITSDALQDDRFQEGQSIVKYNIRSALCVPLWDAEQAYGVVYLDNLAVTYAFTPDDMALLTAIANLIALRVRQERLQDELRSAEVRRSNLARYHSPDVVERLMSQTGDAAMEVREREVTVMFADVVDSTGLSERSGPAPTAELLNTFYEMATSAIFDQKGHVNKFIGDCVMGIFNAPVDLADHPHAAVLAARQLLGDLAHHNERNPKMRFSVRIGINTGPVVVGDVGTRDRREYTALGDAVNVASHLATQAAPNGIVIGSGTHAGLKGRIETRDLGDVKFKGREKPVRVYEVKNA